MTMSLTQITRRIPCFAIALVLGAALSGCATRRPLKLYVSPNGQDDGAGVGWSAARPYRTLPRTALEIQRLVSEGQADLGIVVTLLPGTYRLRTPLVLDPSHSGQANAPVVFQASAKGAATITGSVELNDWQPSETGIFAADLPEGMVTVPQVYAGGRLLTLARYPNVDPERPRSGGMLYALDKLEASGKTSLIYDPKQLDPTKWQHIAQGKIVIWPGSNWNCDRLPLKSADTIDSSLHFGRARYDIRRGNRFYVEGLTEELDAPGEWIAKPDEQKLFLKPIEFGSAPEQVTVPFSPGLLHLSGGKEKGISHIRFVGIRFQECLRSAIVLENTHDCQFISCKVSRTEHAGIVLKQFSSRNRVEGCDITLTGTEGIRLDGIKDAKRTRTRALSGNTIENCHIHHIGTSRNAGGAIDLRPYCGGNIAHNNAFRNNLIHDTPRKGIMMGGVDNIAELNHIHHVNLEQSDTGAIGLCTRDVRERGCIIRHNLIHDVGGYNMLEPGKWAFPSFCWAVYLDDWTSGTHVIGNILLDAPSGGVHVHSGLDNIIEHNIIRGSDKTLIQFSPIKPMIQDGKTVEMSGNIVRHNIALGTAGTPWLRGSHRDWLSGVKLCDQNLLWYDGMGPSCTVSSAKRPTWQEWQSMGFDQNSRIAKPLFVEGTDWKLNVRDAAADLGLRTIPVERIGLYKSGRRFSWPVQSEWQRESPVLTCQIPPAPSARKRAEIPAMTGPIAIDGILAPTEWKEATKLVLERNHRDEPAQPRSVAFVGFDESALYIGMDNVINPNRALNVGPTWGKHDAIEVAMRRRASAPDAPIVVLRAFTDGSSYGSNAGGMELQAARAFGRQCTYATTMAAPLRWLAEVRIPWTAIPGSDGKPCELQFNLTCSKTADKLYLCWKPTGRHSYGVGDEGIITPMQGE